MKEERRKKTRRRRRRRRRRKEKEEEEEEEEQEEEKEEEEEKDVASAISAQSFFQRVGVRPWTAVPCGEALQSMAAHPCSQFAEELKADLDPACTCWIVASIVSFLRALARA